MMGFDGVSVVLDKVASMSAIRAKRASKGLKPKQQAFVREYLIDLNATAAYKRAGYRGSQAAFEANAARLIGNDRVQAAVDAALAERNKRTEITADLVVQETWATYQEARAAEKYSAAATLLHLLGKHTGAFPDKHEHGGQNGEPIPISIIRFNRHPASNMRPGVPGGDGI